MTRSFNDEYIQSNSDHELNKEVEVMTKRFLTPQDIPLSLWDGDNLLSLPPPLRHAYCKILKMKGLLEEARNASSQRSKGSIGGQSQEDTDQHFAHRFDGSCARVELAVLDPKNELNGASDYFVRTFSGGRVRLLDIPCGSGAASATLLTTVAELRRQNIIPREPLDVFLTGGDISDEARGNVELIFNELQQSLRDQGIFVKVSLHRWDIFNPVSTTDFLAKWLQDTPDCNKSFLLIANFSGLLGADKNLKKAEERLGEVFRWVERRKFTVVWIEPPMKAAKKMDEWFKKISQLTRWLYKPAEQSDQLTSEAKFAHPLRDSHPNVRLRIVRLEDHTSHEGETRNLG